MLGQVHRLLQRQFLVTFAHPAHCGFQRRVGTGRAMRAGPATFDPVDPNVRRCLFLSLSDGVGRQTQSLDRHDLIDLVWKEAGEPQADRSAQRMPHDRHWRSVEQIDEQSKVIDKRGDRICPGGRPGAVPMSPQIGRDHVKILRQDTRGPVPAMRMIESAMDQDQQRGRRISPVQIMEARPQGGEEMRCRSRYSRHVPGSCGSVLHVRTTIGAPTASCKRE